MASASATDCELDAETAHELLAHPVRRAAVAALAESAPLSTAELARLVVARDHPGPAVRHRSESERELRMALEERHLPDLERACVVTDSPEGYEPGATFGSLLRVLDTTEELVGRA